MWIILTVSAALTCGLLGGIRSARADLVVPAPCDVVPKGQNPTSGWNSCDTFLNGNTTDPKVIKPGVVARLQNRIGAQMASHRVSGQTYDLDPLQVPNPNPGPNYPITCDPGHNQAFIPAPEIDRAYAANSSLKIDELKILPSAGNYCGNAATITVTTGGTYANFATSQTNPRREYSYMAGGFDQAMGCYYGKVKNEIMNLHQLTVSGNPLPAPSPGTKPSAANTSNLANIGPCANAAQDLMNLMAQFKVAAAKLKNGQKTVDDIYNCENNFSATLTSAGDPGSNRQAAQQLCGVRSNIESSFLQVAACQILSRSSSSYLNRVGSAASQAAIINDLNTTFTATCKAACLPGSLDLQRIQDCANNCYAPKVAPWFQQNYDQWWPADPSMGNYGSCSASAWHSLLFFLFSGKRDSRKRTRKNRRPFARKRRGARS